MSQPIINTVVDVGNERRHQQIHQQLAAVVNSLAQAEELVPVGQNEYSIGSAAATVTLMRILGPRAPYGCFGG